MSNNEGHTLSDGLQKVRVSGQYEYRPWPELRHAARVLRFIAKDLPEGSTHVLTAAVVLGAFSVEAFIQTMGPKVFGDDWPKYERKAVMEKLKLVGVKVGVRVDFGKLPWKRIKDLMKARDALAHAKPAVHVANETLILPASADPREALHKMLDAKYKPLHNLEELEKIADMIDCAFTEIWQASGEQSYKMNKFGGSVWSMSIDRS